MELVTLDLDGTLIETTVFEAAAEWLGLGEDVRFFDDLYFRGLLSLEATFIAEYDLFLDVPIAHIHDALEEGPWLESIAETIQTLRGKGLEVWVVTDQPDWAVAYLSRWGITEGTWTPTSWWEGRRVGAVERYAFEKWPALEEKLEEAGYPPASVCHVGNGTNDIPVFEHVGSAIALNPSGPRVAEAGDRVLHGTDLRPIVDVIDDLRG